MARAYSNAAFKVESVASGDHCRRLFWGRFIEIAQDPGPDRAIPHWLNEGVPSGANEDIETFGVFPLAEKDSASVEASWMFAVINAAREFQGAGHSNYQPFYQDGGDHAWHELERIRAQGFVESFDSWEETRSRWPSAVASKIACFKRKDDGTLKVRLIIGMLRSCAGIIGQCRVLGRVAPPPGVDFANGMLDLMRDLWGHGHGCEEGDDFGIELGSADFVDAFHILKLRGSGRNACAFKGFGGWLVYKVFPFGLALAPFLRGWVGASAMRLA